MVSTPITDIDGNYKGDMRTLSVQRVLVRISRLGRQDLAPLPE